MTLSCRVNGFNRQDDAIRQETICTARQAIIIGEISSAAVTNTVQIKKAKDRLTAATAEEKAARNAFEGLV
jgi:hypothetical protein